MKSIRIPRQATKINWDPKTRRLQVHYKNQQIITFFNVSEEDFEVLNSQRFKNWKIMRLLKSEKYPIDVDRNA